MSPPAGRGQGNDLEQALFGDERLDEGAPAADRPLVVKYGTVKLRVQAEAAAGRRAGAGEPRGAAHNVGAGGHGDTAPAARRDASAVGAVASPGGRPHAPGIDDAARAHDRRPRAQDRAVPRRVSGRLAKLAAAAAALLLLAALAAGLLAMRASRAAGPGRAPAPVGAPAR